MGEGDRNQRRIIQKNHDLTICKYLQINSDMIISIQIYFYKHIPSLDI